MKLCDLHTHSTASDGSFTPSELMDYAKKRGAAAVALTDHDTVAGLEEARLRAEQIGLRLIPGIEMSTRYDGCSIHLVGLFIRDRDPEFRRQIEKIARTRDERNFQMVEKLAAAGFRISLSDLERYRGCILTRAHIGAILIERGYAKTLDEAFNRYLTKGKVGYVARKSPEPETCIRLIHQAGGLAFVAHANQIDRKDPEHGLAVCRTMLDLGADGLETRYCQFDSFWRTRTEALASEFGKLRSGGSDFHGSFKQGLDLLTGYGDLEVPYDFVEAMEQKLGRC